MMDWSHRMGDKTLFCHRILLLMLGEYHLFVMKSVVQSWNFIVASE